VTGLHHPPVVVTLVVIAHQCLLGAVMGNNLLIGRRLGRSVAALATFTCIAGVTTAIGGTAAQASTKAPATAVRYGTANVHALVHAASAASTAGPTTTAAPRATTSPSSALPAHEFSQRDAAEEPDVKADAPATSGPAVAGSPVAASSSRVRSFDGIDAADSRLARNGNAFTNEPSDAAICQGGGVALQAVNAAVQFFTPGAAASPVIALSQFFGLPPEIDRSNNTFPGPSLGDIRCVFDAGTGRMMLIAWGTSQDPTTGAFTGHNIYFLAVAATSDPLGTYNLYAIEVAPPSERGCPCLADHPTLATDANTVVTTFNRIRKNGTFGGAVVVALSKADMEAGATTPVVQLSAGRLGGGLLYTLQGGTPSPGGPYATAHNGTMWFLSALQFVAGVPDNRIALEALVNTNAIDSHPGQLSLLEKVVPGVLSYNVPPMLPQRNGPIPLGKSVGEPENGLDGGSDETQATTFAGGDLWTVIDTALGRHGQIAGLLWMRVHPSFTNNGIAGIVVRQGYVAAVNADLAYGAIAVTADTNSVALVASLSSSHNFPSAVTARITSAGVSGLSLYGVGAAPEDGFTCYQAFVGPSAVDRGCRWGDYSAINVGTDGNFWMMSEYITARPRVSGADWGTRIGVTPVS